MLYRFLLLGQIPGTNIDLNFYEIMALIVAFATYGWNRRYRTVSHKSLLASIGNWYRQTDNGLQLTQWARLIARKG